MTRRLGNLIGFLAAAFVLWALVSATGSLGVLCGVLLPMVVFVYWRLIRGQERKRLINDCVRQHVALMRGNEAVGLYGNFMPYSLDTFVEPVPSPGSRPPPPPINWEGGYESRHDRMRRVVKNGPIYVDDCTIDTWGN